MPKKYIDKSHLRELWSKGLSVAQIAKEIGIKTGTVYKYAHKFNFPKRNRGYQSVFDKDPDKLNWFIKNYPEMSNGTLSVYLGLSPKYLGRVARRLGLKKSEEYWESLKEYHRKQVKQFHEKKKGDKEYYAYNQRPRLNGKFIKKNKDENIS